MTTSIEAQVNDWIANNYIKFVKDVIEILDSSYVTLQYDKKEDEGQECINGVPTGHRMFHIFDEAYPKLTALAIQQEDLEEVLAGRFGFSFVPSNCCKCYILAMIRFYITENHRYISLMGLELVTDRRLVDIWQKFNIAFDNLEERLTRITRIPLPTSIQTKAKNYIKLVEDVIEILDSSYVTLQYDKKEDKGRECINSVPTGHRMFHISDEAYPKLHALLMQQFDLEKILAESGIFFPSFVPSSCNKCNIYSMIHYYIVCKYYRDILPSSSIEERPQIDYIFEMYGRVAWRTYKPEIVRI